jgi:hypothetical protein
VLALAGEAAMYGLKVGVLFAVVLLVCLLDRKYPVLWNAVYVTNGATAIVVYANIAAIIRV